MPPPLVYVGFFLLALALQRWLWPLPWWRGPVGFWLALIALLLNVVLFGWSVGRFRAARTSMVPILPTTAVVTDGPYRFTRNPMYLSLLLLYTALACWSGLTWALLLVPLLIAVMNVAVIGPEERYLEGKFGEPYRAYRARVRRWI